MYDLKTTGPTPTDLASRTEFRNVLVPIHQLLEAAIEAGQSLNGRRFVDCVIRGPGVIIPSADTRFVNSNLGDVSGDVRNIFLRAAGPSIIGGVPVDGCVFEGCLFIGVGLAGDDAFVDAFVTALTADKA